MSAVNQRQSVRDEVSLETCMWDGSDTNLPQLTSLVGKFLWNFFWTQECPLDTSLLDCIS